MSEDIRLRGIDLQNPAYLIVTGPTSLPEVANLTSGSSVFVGSGSNCKIELVDDQVKPIQCMLWLESSNVMKVQDWNTGTTFLNDAVVTEEIQVKSGDVLTVGSHRLTAVLDREFHFGIAVELLNNDQLHAESHKSPISQPEPDGSAIAGNVADDATGELHSNDAASHQLAPTQRSGFSSDLPAQEIVAAAESGGFSYDIDADLDEDEPNGELEFNFGSVSTEFSFSAAASDSDQGDDELSMMRMEVEQIRFELADRESKIEQLQSAQSESHGEDALGETETLKLVTRLEDLLDELKSSDDRINGLEELLRVSDNATEAEKEERQQLEHWVTEIEQRVGQREAEAQAEISRLSKRLRDAKEESEHSANQLKSLTSNSGSISTDQRAAVTALAQQVELLREKLKIAREENQQLHQRPALAEGETDLSAKLKVAEDETVRLKVEMSRERAEMARRHAELEGIRDELEDRLKNVRVVDPGDSRIQTMREHLREIHAREEAEKADKRPNGLGGRIANLLTRLR